jgi:Kef-type K+ transport system membrane component KefB
VALAGTGHKQLPWPLTLLLLACFVAIMMLPVRSALRWWVSRPSSALSNQLTMALVLALSSAWVTASLGLHPVFGGFLAGLTMPSVDGAPDPDVLRPMDQIASLFGPAYLAARVSGLTGRDAATIAVLLNTRG